MKLAKKIGLGFVGFLVVLLVLYWILVPAAHMVRQNMDLKTAYQWTGEEFIRIWNDSFSQFNKNKNDYETFPMDTFEVNSRVPWKIVTGWSRDR